MAISLCLYGADTDNPIITNEIEFIAPNVKDTQVSTVVERPGIVSFKASVREIKFLFHYRIVAFDSFVYKSAEDFIMRWNKDRYVKDDAGQKIDVYFREYTKGIQAWITESMARDKETKMLMAADYYACHQIYRHAGIGGIYIQIFQEFERANTHAQEISSQLMMECVRNTKFQGKQLITEPKFFKNKNAMLDQRVVLQ
jgi:hypothetical protein